MFVQVLTAYADTYLRDQMRDPAFEERPVPFAVEIYEDGIFAGVREYMDEVKRGKKTTQVARKLKVPKSPVNRNSTLFPLLGCDAIQYLLGPNVGVWTKPEELFKHQKHYDGFVSLMHQAASEVNDQGLRACAAFYDRAEEVQKARDCLASRKPRAGSLVTLAVASRDPASCAAYGPIIEWPAAREYWRKRYASAFSERVERGREGMCLICGKVGAVAPTHDKIKGLANIGGQPSGVSLMSFDKHAFRSYGWDQNGNSPVCPDQASSYVLALNDLLVPGEHRRGYSSEKVLRTRFDCGGVAFVYWTRAPSDDDIHGLFSEAQPEQVHELFKSLQTGKAAVEVEPNDFYLAAVSGNGGRLLVRYWFRDTLANVRGNMRKWFKDLRIADAFNNGALSEPPKLWQLLASISSAKGTPSEKVEKVSSDRIIQLVRRALHGLPLGRTILVAALGQVRIGKGAERLSPVRVGLVRMCVNDIENVEKKGRPIMGEILNPDLDHPSYVCGRLLALYDILQYQAQGEVNVTASDRYYGMASTYPRLAFPKLESLSKAHLKKLRRDNPGAAVNIEKEIRELMTRLSNFPSQLSLEDRGRFVIGFHHQKAENARRAAEAKARKAEMEQSAKLK